MSRFYGVKQRALQDHFNSRRLADKMESTILHAELTDADKAFIESRDMLWISTIDEQGCPTVSYKGGDPGFVRVLDEKSIVFPLYDGNGMFLSAGNISAQAQVGMLFMDFERPGRLRLQGVATVSDTDELMAQFPEAQLLVRVSITRLWPNCPRYVHRYIKQQASRYVPRAICETPLAGWKRIDEFQESLPEGNTERAEKAGGLVTMEEWFDKAAQGDPEA